MFVPKKGNACIYGMSSDTVFNNSVIAICELFRGTRSSQQEEQFERWSCYRHFRMNNDFSARTICRGVKIFSIARIQTLPLPGLLCTQICSGYWQSRCIMLTLSTWLWGLCINWYCCPTEDTDIRWEQLQMDERRKVLYHACILNIHTKFPTQESVLVLHFALLGFAMNHNSETCALNQYKAPRQHYLCLITIWLESLEMSSQQASH